MPTLPLESAPSDAIALFLGSFTFGTYSPSGETSADLFSKLVLGILKWSKNANLKNEGIVEMT